MCGLAGILRVYPPGASVPAAAASIPQAWLDVLDEHIKHRGPDGFGVFRDRAVRSDGATVDVALIHRRLAIIDPACGQQPMVSADGRVAVVFNGCIYNHAELRRELQQQGCVFQTDHSDTEVLVQGWRAWGGLLFEKLEGMYAALIWDRERAHLMRARDRFGEKPLYASIHTPHMQWFASSAAACIALHDVVRTDMQMRTDAPLPDMSAWLARGAALACVGHSVVEHPPGWQESPLGIDPQLDPVSLFPHAAPAHADEPLTRERLESLLRQSVIARMVSDVPLGCFLSGGVDSSLIAAFAQEHLRARGQRLQTFTMQMPHAAYDESPFAQAVAEHLQTEHHVLSCARDVASDLVMLIEQLGLPFGDSSLLPTYWLCKAARQHVKVALAGDGGDELFAGYDRHWAGLFLSKYGRVLRSLPGAALLASDDPKSGRNKLARLVDAAKHAGYQDLVAIFPASMYAQLTDTPIDAELMQRARAADRQHYPWQHDTLHYLPDDLLRKTDTASMAVALEVRCPFLARELAAAAWHTPPHVLMPRGERKGLLRAVARRFLPPAIVDRPKQGFAIPVGDWLRESSTTPRAQRTGLRDLYLDLVINARDPFPPHLLGLTINRAYVQQLTDQHMHRTRDHAQRLYLLLVVAIWCRWMERVGKGNGEGKAVAE